MYLSPFPFSTGPVEPRTVEKVFQRVGRICEVDVAGRCLMTTAEHPFYVQNRGWTRAMDLEPGDELIGTGEKTVTVERVCSTDREATVYNLRVAEYHTYFVGSPEWGFDVWVHNTYAAVERKGVWGVFDDATGNFITVDPNTQKAFDQHSASRAANKWNDLAAKKGSREPFQVFLENGKTGIWSEMDSDGYITFKVNAEDSPISGSDFFRRMMEHHGSEVTGIRGVWVSKSLKKSNKNLGFVNKLTAAGISLEDAVKQAWTAKQAALFGFHKIQIVKVIGSPGNYSMIEVLITK